MCVRGVMRGKEKNETEKRIKNVKEINGIERIEVK